MAHPARQAMSPADDPLVSKNQYSSWFKSGDALSRARPIGENANKKRIAARPSCRSFDPVGVSDSRSSCDIGSELFSGSVGTSMELRYDSRLPSETEAGIRAE